MVDKNVIYFFQVIVQTSLIDTLYLYYVWNFFCDIYVAAFTN